MIECKWDILFPLLRMDVVVDFCISLKGGVSLLCEKVKEHYKSMSAWWLFLEETFWIFVVEYENEGQ